MERLLQMRWLIVAVLMVSCSDGKRLHSLYLLDRAGLRETITDRVRLNELKDVGGMESHYAEIMKIFKYGDGSLRGWLSSYHRSGHVKESIEVVDGRVKGVYREWYPDGSPKVWVRVLDGEPSFDRKALWLLDGKGVAWRDDGSMESEVDYVGGMMEGRALYYYPSGRAKSIEYYKGDQLLEFFSFDENGFMVEDFGYKNGLKEGRCDGRDYHEVYLSGRLIKGVYYHMGEVVSEVADGNGERVTRDGDLSCRVAIRGGEPDGLVTIHKGDILVNRYSIKNGVKEGLEEIFQDGRLLSSLSWKEGDISGEVKSYHSNGALHSRGEYLDGVRFGDSAVWHPSGDLMMVEHYGADGLIWGSYFDASGEIVSEVVDGSGVATICEDGRISRINYVNGLPCE